MMTTQQHISSFPYRKGTYYELSGGGITLFGLRAFHQGDAWVMSVPFSRSPEGYMDDYVSPVQALSILEYLLQMAVAQGEAVERFVLSSRMATCLYLEGVLTYEAFDTAEEMEDAVVLLLSLSGSVHLVEIRTEFALEYDVCMLDSLGRVIEQADR